MRTIHWLSAALLALAFGAGGRLLLLHEETALLRNELAWQQEEHRELGRLRAEQQGLLAAQPPAAELDWLHADRAALVRLRTEVENLKASAAELEKMEQQAATAVAPTSPPPHVTLRIAIAQDGSVTMAGMPLNDLGTLRQHFTGLTKGHRAEVRIELPSSRPGVPSASIKQKIEEVFRTAKEFAKEQGFACSIRLEGARGR